MKEIFLFLTLALSFGLGSNAIFGQDLVSRPSPAKEAKGSILEAQVTIQYSAPSVKGRAIWDDLVPYGKVWRTGANEATTIETDIDLTLQGHILPAGKYALFTIPGEKEWTWVFNTVWEQWGAYRYDESKDALRLTAVSETSPVFHEQLRFEVTEQGIAFYWENLMVHLK